MLLEVSGASAGYYNRNVIHDVNMSLDASEIVSLIGHNGAGKTTTLKTIFGIVPTRSGSITYNNTDITNDKPMANVKNGMCLVPQEYFVFPDLSVKENLLLAAHGQKRDKEGLENCLDEVYRLFKRLKDRHSQNAGTLSGGEQRMLSMGMVLMARPKFVMFDEPSLGLAPLIVKEVGRIIAEIAENGISVLLVEQNVKQAMKLANRVYVMKLGRIVLEERGSTLLEQGQWWDLF